MPVTVLSYNPPPWAQKIPQDVANYLAFSLRSFVKVSKHLVRNELGIVDPTMVRLVFVAVVAAWIGVALLVLSLCGAGRARKQQLSDDTQQPKEGRDRAMSAISSLSGTTVGQGSGGGGSGQASIFNFDDFMLRLHRSAIVVNKYKDKETKSRCLRIGSDCDLKLYKLYRTDNGEVTPLGPSYLRLPLADLLDCFECRASNKSACKSFILEFRSKSLQLSAVSGMDTKQLLRGFRHLASRIKEDKAVLGVWRERYQQTAAAPAIGGGNSDGKAGAAEGVQSPAPSGSTGTGTGSYYKTKTWSFGKKRKGGKEGSP